MYRKKAGKLELDGLPAAGSRIVSGDPIYCYYDHEKKVYTGEFFIFGQILRWKLRIFALK